MVKRHNHCLSDMQGTGNTLDSGAVTAVCASDFIFMEHKALGQGGEVPHTEP